MGSAVRRGLMACMVVCVAGAVAAKESPPQVIDWPDSGSPVLRFSFGKMQEVASAGNRPQLHHRHNGKEFVGQGRSERGLLLVLVRQE